jgi:probable HAF family extracellular repeat protein
MNTRGCYTMRNLILAPVLSLSIGFASSALAQERALLVDLNSKEATNLGTLGGDFSYPSGINDAGQVVGQSYTYDGPPHAFITGPDSAGMNDLGTLGGGYSFAYGINDMGQVVGNSGSRAFITGPNGVGMTDLGTLGGGRESYANGINDAGRVVGFSYTAENVLHAFITGPNGVGMTDLGTLGGRESVANGINDAGQVVGYADTAAGDQHAFITGPNGVGMTDLGSVVNSPFYSATAINNHGQVAAIGPIPEPETYAMLLAGLGLLGFIAPPQDC